MISSLLSKEQEYCTDGYEKQEQRDISKLHVCTQNHNPGFQKSPIVRYFLRKDIVP